MCCKPSPPPQSWQLSLSFLQLSQDLTLTWYFGGFSTVLYILKDVISVCISLTEFGNFLSFSWRICRWTWSIYCKFDCDTGTWFLLVGRPVTLVLIQWSRSETILSYWTFIRSSSISRPTICPYTHTMKNIDSQWEFRPTANTVKSFVRMENWG